MLFVICYTLLGRQKAFIVKQEAKKESYRSFEELDWLALLDINAEALCKNVSGQPKVDHKSGGRIVY